MLTPGELAAQLGVDVRDLKRLRDEGRGPAYITLTPRTIRYLSSEVADWLSDDTAD
ncbi:helix-turn-helix transcriptional regulator [Pseudarthrobacter sp. J47]|jgi:predicted DNA-binding transcriptional regulator AlpA|nr:helix-turn-helix domain-containing protein [Pseudarthrobacter sp. J47]MEE2524376.1 helix-turn-helix domain-containing protein [Pseudarthrobacter sp. J47]